MDRITILMKQMKEKLDSELENTEVRLAHSSEPSSLAPLTPVIVIEQGAVTVRRNALGDYLSGGLGKRVKAAIKFTIIVPASSGVETCTELFSGLCRSLLFDPDFGMISMTAASVQANAQKRAYELSATGILEYNMLKKEEER